MQATEGYACTVAACPLELVLIKRWHHLALWLSRGEQRETF